MVVGVVAAERAPHLPCCVWLAVCGRELCGCAGTGRLTVCSSDSSSGTHTDVHVCARWHDALVCMCMRKSSHRRHMWGHPPQMSPLSPGSPGSMWEGLNAAGLWTED